MLVDKYRTLLEIESRPEIESRSEIESRLGSRGQHTGGARSTLNAFLSDAKRDRIPVKAPRTFVVHRAMSAMPGHLVFTMW